MFSRLVLLGAVLLATGVAKSAEPGNRLEPIASLIDGQTFAVARVELERIDVAAALQMIARLTGDSISADELKTRSGQLQGFLATLREYGVQDAYIVVSLADIPENPPPLLLTLKAGANEALITTQLKQLGNLPWKSQARMKNVLAFGAPATLDRLKTLKPIDRPDLVAAFSSTNNETVQIAAAIPADARRVVRELVTKLPPEIGGGEGQDLLDALQWMSLAIQTPPKSSLRWIIQSKDEASAASLRPRILAGLNMLLQGAQARLPDLKPEAAQLAIRLTPQIKGDRLELAVAAEEVEKLAKQLVTAGPFGAMQESAARAQSINNLKQIALAMHNYHDVNRAFPAAANRSKAGKPLLSWRVHILPYLDQAALYEQFRLDEAWDSEHNSKLIAQMPKVYLDPATPVLQKDGKTIYVVPVGERSVFGDKEGTHIGKIVDGTSNTLMVVDIPPISAVVWTKPDDWPFEIEDPSKGLLNGKREIFLAAFCDGSVRVLPATIDPTDLRRLVQKDDGEVLSKQY